MMVTMTQTAPLTGAHGAGWHRALSWLAVVLATAGVVLASVMVLGALTKPEPAAVGRPVETGYGSFTVTRASTTFVPATQGPPTMAKMMGTVGANQLQVWLRFVNEEADNGLRYSPGQLRLTVASGPKPRTLAPSGSSLTDATLPLGAAIDGQVWFDLRDGDADFTLTYTAPDGEPVEVPLSAKPAPASEHGHGAHH